MKNDGGGSKEAMKANMALEKGEQMLMENVKYLMPGVLQRENGMRLQQSGLTSTSHSDHCEKWAWEIIGYKLYVSSIMLISRVQQKAGSTNTAFHIWGQLLLFWSQPFSEFNISPSTASQICYPI